MKFLSTVAGIVVTFSLFANTSTIFAQAPDAQSSAASIDQESEEPIIVQVGDVFEIMTNVRIDGATYSWILTQERTFIEAGREQFFRYRFVQNKLYTLRADIVLPDTNERLQHMFTINVRLQGDQLIPTASSAGTGASLAGTIPAADQNGRVVLAPSQHVLQLKPTRTDLSPLVLDIDASRDSDGDGNPGNDIDNASTYFHLFGRSLWVWFARPLSQADLVVTAAPAGASPLVQRISVMNEETARGQGVLTSPVSIRVEQIDQTSFAFSPERTQPSSIDSPLLYEWEFGDGERSLETNPTHQYPVGGSMTVKLHIRDLQTGNTVGRAETTVTPVVPPPSSAQSSDVSSEAPSVIPPDEPTDTTGFPWGRLLLFGGIFIVALLIGIVIVWLLSFLRRSHKIEKTLASIENVVAPSKDTIPPPLAIKSKPQTPSLAAQQKVIDAEISAATPSKQGSAPVKEEVAPEWLKKGLAPVDQKKSQPSPAAAPATPKPLQPEPPKATPTPATPPVIPAKPTPTPSPSPITPKPAPIQPPKQPTPPVAPSPPSPPAANLPRWLQPTPPTAVPPSAPKTEPTPPTPQATPSPVPSGVAAPRTTASSASAPPAPTSASPSASVSTPSSPSASVSAPVPNPLPTQFNQPLPQAPVVQPKPVQNPAPVVASPTPAPIAPAPKPQPSVPPPTLPTSPIPPAPIAPMQAAPTMPTPQVPAPRFDDDQPIAIIRAENINPGPTK